MFYENGKPIPDHPSAKSFKSFSLIYDITSTRAAKRWIWGIFFVLVVFMFVPWTQTITGTGQLTSLQPNQRPQTIHSVIPGRIEKWFVREGQYVNKGDTIMYISEIKDDYFDPNLLVNVQEQIKAKEFAVKSYMQKVEALDAQIDAMNQNRELKLQQQELKIKQNILKVTTDSTDARAASENYKVAEQQIKRFQDLFAQDLISETELEQREVNAQNAKAKFIDTQNKLLIARQELINSRTELNTLRAEFRDKISKAESEKFATMSSMFDAEATVTKLQNSFANYSVRSGFYYITAPQNGYITRAIQTGVGETIKEGTEIISIMPSEYQLAVEMFVDPLNLPLVRLGEKVRFIFDGWPAFVFSGWPGASFGTYGGQVVAVDNFISTNGKYRILVSPDPNDEPWPDGLRVGAGAQGFALLNDVAIGYELWRQFNGFPPDFYKPGEGQQQPATKPSTEPKKDK
jgi:membrane fusion protein, adhesin transport system